MDIKNFDELSDLTLNLLWDLNGAKSKNEVIELLQKEVFSQIPKESFTTICNQLKANINNHPKSEIGIFEEALEIFLRDFFELKWIKYGGHKNEKIY